MQRRIIKTRKQQAPFTLSSLKALLLPAVLSILLYACNSSSGNSGVPISFPSLPVVTVGLTPATTYTEFSSSLEGSKDIEIRPQVDGILDRIFVDEGAYVKKGQALFQVNDRPYREQMNTARAGLLSAQANLLTAEINVSKLTPLVESNIVSEIQLKTAKATQSSAAAMVSQAQAQVQQASINIGYTQIVSPVDGYVGRIPFKTGSLVGSTTPQALTVVSSVREIYAYFSFSEKDFLLFRAQFPGATIEEKIKHMPPVDLVLADNTVYAEKGKVETVSGQFSNTMGAISFRAVFDNKDGLLRAGNTGKIRVPRLIDSSLAVPQEATFELQDKVFVFVLTDSNKVLSTPIEVSAKTNNYYLVGKGLKSGDRIVYTGLDRLKDGAIIQPQALSMDSLLKSNPL
ncbi:MAG TPA: efflux RND transporter periplasmic adaptor subunit [Chitinophagaceae bacterium]|nr:efflux RND transporter periplasmic adaptor subunit [Chitinophagaceae bacterium]